MPYSHEIPLLKAYSKLYSMSKRRRYVGSTEESGKDMAGMVTGGINLAKLHAARQAELKRRAAAALKQRQAQEAADQAQMDDDVRYIRGGPEAFKEFSDVREGLAVPTNPYKEELDRIHADRVAREAPIGGVWTPRGLEMNQQNGMNDAHDKLLMRSLIPTGGQQLGLGGSVR